MRAMHASGGDTLNGRRRPTIRRDTPRSSRIRHFPIEIANNPSVYERHRRDTKKALYSDASFKLRPRTTSPKSGRNCIVALKAVIYLQLFRTDADPTYPCMLHLKEWPRCPPRWLTLIDMLSISARVLIATPRASKHIFNSNCKGVLACCHAAFCGYAHIAALSLAVL